MMRWTTRFAVLFFFFSVMGCDSHQGERPEATSPAPPAPELDEKDDSSRWSYEDCGVCFDSPVELTDANEIPVDSCMFVYKSEHLRVFAEHGNNAQDREQKGRYSLTKGERAVEGVWLPKGKSPILDFKVSTSPQFRAQAAKIADSVRRCGEIEKRKPETR